MKNNTQKMLSLWVLIIGLATQSWAQDPSIVWQKTYGGSASDVVYSLQATSDGGYILGGYSNSNASGEKTENSRGGIDGWIVKTDSNGNILWDKTYGGSADDFLLSLHETSDGGFIVGMGSESNISGDKTENSRGGLDYWILKLNASGNIQWQKTYGGAQPEFDTHIFQTADGGYFVSGYSDSNVSGDKTDPTNGQRDYWVLKLNSSGNIVWQNSIGGSTVDRAIISIQTNDGGFMIGGHSDSNTSGDKSENSRGLFDNWIVKLDASGNIQWNKTYGGDNQDIIRDIIQVGDGYIVGGYSHSGISGDKTEELRGVIDYWVYKINNSGNMVWQKGLGGSQTDYLRTIRQKSDGNLLVTGYSNSNASGDKTDNSNGGYDMWFLLLDENGSILGQNTIGGSAHETAGYSVILNDGYIFGVASESNISGDKTENSRGQEDYWLFKTTNSLLHISEFENQNSFALFPNPSQGMLTVDFGNVYSRAQIIITDMSGKTIFNKHYTHTDTALVQYQGASGVYFITLLIENQKPLTKKLLKI